MNSSHIFLNLLKKEFLLVWVEKSLPKFVSKLVRTYIFVSYTSDHFGLTSMSAAVQTFSKLGK